MPRSFTENRRRTANSRDMRTRPNYKPSNIKDIRAGKSQSPAPDILLVNLKIATNTKHRTPSMPKMPWG